MSTSNLSSAVHCIRTLWVLNQVERHFRAFELCRERRLARAADLRAIADLASNGHVAVIVWSRDCDHVCGESRTTIEASIRAYDAFRDRQLRDAEGPMRFRLARVDEPFEGWSRDTIAEAHEDGHPHQVADAMSRVPTTC